MLCHRLHRGVDHPLDGGPLYKGWAIGALRNFDAEPVPWVFYLVVVLQAAPEGVDSIPYGSVLQSGVVSWATERSDGHRILT